MHFSNTTAIANWVQIFNTAAIANRVQLIQTPGLSLESVRSILRAEQIHVAKGSRYCSAIS